MENKDIIDIGNQEEKTTQNAPKAQSKTKQAEAKKQADAQKQADAKVKEVENKILGLIDEHEITKKAVANANEIIAKAQKDGREIRLASLKFADDILEKVETDFKAVNERVKQCRSELRK